VADQKFCNKLEKAIKDLLAHRIKVGEKYYATTKNRQVLWSKQYYENLQRAKELSMKQDMSGPVVVSLPAAADSKSKNTFAKRSGWYAKAKRSGKPREDTLSSHVVPFQALVEADSKAYSVKPVNRFYCYYCDEEGHIARNCTAKAAISAKGMGRSAVTCYNCNEEGHIARNCNVSRKANNPDHVAAKLPVRNIAGRNRNFRHSQRDRFANHIDVTANGEGLRTCDREVRKGEVTRTGLVI
jgi:hypothetical protein